MIKPIKNYEDIYAISNKGEVINIKTGNMITPWITNKGYMCVDLNKDGNKKHMLLHRLVADAYVPNPNNYPIVLHLDNNKLNIDPSNLAWGTYSENNAQAIRDGLNKVPRPDNRKLFAILNDKEVIHCYGQQEVVNTIGYGNVQVAHNIVNRHSKVKEGPYKGYYIERFENVKMCNIVKK